jgi:hypothetical protein
MSMIPNCKSCQRAYKHGNIMAGAISQQRYRRKVEAARGLVVAAICGCNVHALVAVMNALSIITYSQSSPSKDLSKIS